MSAEAEAQPLTAPSYSSGGGGNDIVKDLVLWRRRKLSASVLIAATATWVLMEVYQFNFLTIISWLAIFVVVSMFLYANMFRLLSKEPLNLSRLELTQETAERMGNTVRAWIEEAIRLLFRVSAEEDWTVFVGVVAGLWLLSYIGSYMHFLTFFYIGTVAAMTVPVTYVKNENKIKRFVEWLKEKSKMFYEIIDEKAINKIIVTWFSILWWNHEPVREYRFVVLLRTGTHQSANWFSQTQEPDFFKKKNTKFILPQISFFQSSMALSKIGI